MYVESEGLRVMGASRTMWLQDVPQPLSTCSPCTNNSQVLQQQLEGNTIKNTKKARGRDERCYFLERVITMPHTQSVTTTVTVSVTFLSHVHARPVPGLRALLLFDHGLCFQDFRRS